MRISAFIKANLDAIVADWEAFARTLPSAQAMSTLALRDHSREILLAIAAGMEIRQTAEQRSARSEDITPTAQSVRTAAAEHGALRQLAGFDIVQLFAEFRALRASVMAFWFRTEGPGTDALSADEILRFNECMDQALAESVDRYSSEVAASRDMFLAVLGHDLRGPLSSINLSTMVLAKADLSDESRQRAVARNRRATQEMSGLITDLLEYTRTRLGPGIPIERAPCDLAAVCLESLESMRAIHPEQQFVAEVAAQLDAQADAPRLLQALSNLLNNAVQHGDRKAPITLRAEAGPDIVLLSVSNMGPPIPVESMQAIFEPLVSAPNAQSQTEERSKTSLGLGLFIVREIVLGHAGTIEVSSTAEAGTVFTIRLPRQA